MWSGQLKINSLKRLIDKNLPIIILLQAWSENGSDYTKTQEYAHYVIVCGYDDEKQEIYFEDPAIFGIGYLKFDELLKRWHAEGDNGSILKQYGIVIWGKKIFNYKQEFIHLE